MSYRIPAHCPHKPVSLSSGNHPRSYNLNIQSYSFDELLNIFDLPKHNMTIDDLKRAKKKALMVHPDKSNLPPDYFLFYKKAYETILQHFLSTNKHNMPTTAPVTQQQQYQPIYHTDKQTATQIRQSATEMDKSAFQQEFNRLYDQHAAVKPDNSRNQWFTDTTNASPLSYSGSVNSGNMANAFRDLKTQQQTMVKYTGVRELRSSNAGTQFHDSVDDDDAEDVYVCSDPFSKLKFDDLRKVYRDQTIMPVSETDFDNAKQYASVEQYQRERGSQPLTPMEKAQAEQMMAQREREHAERMARRQHQANLQTMQYEEMNNTVRSHFLRLDNR